MGGDTGGCGGVTTYPHFCGLYPVGGTTQFTLYTCGVLQLAAPQKLCNSHSALALGNSASCTVWYYSDTENLTYSLASWILYSWGTGKQQGKNCYLFNAVR